jgi:hypothetical protein
MKHVVYGVISGEDFLTYKQEIPLSIEDLTVIMGWINRDDYVFDFRLTPQQIKDIEELSSLKFPENLDLYLSYDS